MDFLDTLFSKRQISDSTKALYARNLKSLNDGNPVNNLNFLKTPHKLKPKSNTSNQLLNAATT